MTEGVSDFLVPDLGEGLEEATITAWSVAVGDTVELNQTLCTVETNKAEVEIPSPYAGRVVERGGDEGETLAVGAVLVRIATGVEQVAEAGPKRRPVLVGYGADDDMDVSRRATAPPSDRPRAKPPVRKLATELNVDLAESGRLGPRRRDHARGRPCRGRQVGAEPRHGRGAWCAGRDGASNDVVAQSDTGRQRWCAGRLLWADAAAGADARCGGRGFADHPVRADAAAPHDLRWGITRT